MSFLCLCAVQDECAWDELDVLCHLDNVWFIISAKIEIDGVECDWDLLFLHNRLFCYAIDVFKHLILHRTLHLLFCFFPIVVGLIKLVLELKLKFLFVIALLKNQLLAPLYFQIFLFLNHVSLVVSFLQSFFFLF